jgi:hypothetical protein
MGIGEFFGDIWNALTSNVLCMFLALAVGLLLMVGFYVWWIHKVRSENAWTHQPLVYKKGKY